MADGLTLFYLRDSENSVREDICFLKNSGKIEDNLIRNNGFKSSVKIERADFIRKHLDFFVDKFKEQKPEQYERVLPDLEKLLEKLK